MAAQSLSSSTVKTFQAHWLENESLKKWLIDVPWDETKFMCCACNKILKGGLTEIQRHVTHIHSLNAMKNVLSQSSSVFYDPAESNDNLSSEPPKKKVKHFFSSWLQDPRFSAWLQEHPFDKTKFICKACDKILSGGHSEILKHSQAGTHIKICPPPSHSDCPPISHSDCPSTSLSDCPSTFLFDYPLTSLSNCSSSAVLVDKQVEILVETSPVKKL